MTVDGLTSTGGAVQDTNATAMMATGIVVTTMMVVMVMMLVLTVNCSSIIGVSASTRAGIGSPLAAAVGVIE